MKINVAKSAGFCFGVKHAIDIARRNAQSEAKIEMLVILFITKMW
jgi:4-hydroxy-3-methylbut-2-enyl diphosphate reductase IspH